ncbi:hypothetical protein AAY473_025032 [Plecturocebus cupreus]
MATSTHRLCYDCWRFPTLRWQTLRKEFLEREGKDGLCCKRSPKRKIEELNMLLQGTGDNENLIKLVGCSNLVLTDEASMFVSCWSEKTCQT